MGIECAWHTFFCSFFPRTNAHNCCSVAVVIVTFLHCFLPFLLFLNFIGFSEWAFFYPLAHLTAEENENRPKLHVINIWLVCSTHIDVEWFILVVIRIVETMTHDIICSCLNINVDMYTMSIHSEGKIAPTHTRLGVSICYFCPSNCQQNKNTSWTFATSNIPLQNKFIILMSIALASVENLMLFSPLQPRFVFVNPFEVLRN